MRRLVLLALLACGPAVAQEASTPPARGTDASRIDGTAAANVQGVASLNVAAGVGNAQANVRAIEIGEHAQAAGVVRQTVDAGQADLQRDARAVLGGAALESVQGVVGLNQAAGGANAQLNVLAVGTQALAAFGQPLDNLVLAGSRVDAVPDTAGAAPAALREARIEGAALRASGGVVQLNQTAGAGNASANVIVLQLPGSTP